MATEFFFMGLLLSSMKQHLSEREPELFLCPEHFDGCWMSPALMMLTVLTAVKHHQMKLQGH
jgi:hypothetical protein